MLKKNDLLLSETEKQSIRNDINYSPFKKDVPLKYDQEAWLKRYHKTLESATVLKSAKAIRDEFDNEPNGDELDILLHFRKCQDKLNNIIKELENKNR